ncbi:MAG: amino acid ABC transporter permease [Clostridiales Family XIII bacterium]|jgi:L-cystine transport system permease protein|nr:amino acid ABC transporter permease [Clostridiales Family XIII bacterium]
MGEKYFRWDYVLDYFPKLFEKLPVTLSIVLMATLFGSIIAVFVAFIRLERIPVLNQLCVVFVSFMRSTPIIVQMFLLFFGSVMIFNTLFGINIITYNKIWFVYAAYALNLSGFMAEIFRGAILGVPKKQMDAAISVGHNRRQAYLHIIIPQAAVIALPTLGYTIVALLQDSTLAFTFGIIDVIGAINGVSASTGHKLEGYFDAAFMFAILAILVEKLFGFLEKKTTHQSRIT